MRTRGRAISVWVASRSSGAGPSASAAKSPISLAINRCLAAMKPVASWKIGSGLMSVMSCLLLLMGALWNNHHRSTGLCALAIRCWLRSQAVLYDVSYQQQGPPPTRYHSIVIPVNSDAVLVTDPCLRSDKAHWVNFAGLDCARLRAPLARRAAYLLCQAVPAASRPRF